MLCLCDRILFHLVDSLFGDTVFYYHKTAMSPFPNPFLGNGKGNGLTHLCKCILADDGAIAPLKSHRNITTFKPAVRNPHIPAPNALYGTSFHNMRKAYPANMHFFGIFCNKCRSPL